MRVDIRIISLCFVQVSGWKYSVQLTGSDVVLKEVLPDEIKYDSFSDSFFFSLVCSAVFVDKLMNIFLDARHSCLQKNW